jgi:hypothetical protein
LGAAIVASTAWLVLQSGKVSWLLLFVALFSATILPRSSPGNNNLLFAVSAFIAALFFAAPLLLIRQPRSADDASRFNRSSIVWFVVYLLALLWFVEPDF